MGAGDQILAPVFSSDDLRRKAAEFLARHHPTGGIPIPIEELVEFQLGVNIVPMPGLHEMLEADAFTSSELADVHVDEFIYRCRPTRYRFTLAHEVGHMVLHRDLYLPRHFASLVEWRAFVQSIPEKEHGWLEYQAHAFAGLVLVPPEPLVRETAKCVARVQAEGLRLSENWDFAWTRIAAFLGKTFAVSSQVIERRLNKDELPSQYRNQ
ncbi:MAG: ImmA/IrrE family metallo-endopeptidase [Planctomycetes bacterium]|nr:ImmA/IrrE family metallo-endopeptidase [Planctomycetota bacterium]